jgi:hypothetical protein
MPVIQMPNGLSIRTYELPPADFDPLTAPESLLLRYGFPSRPDPQTLPELYKRWERAFSRKLTYIVPTFQELKEVTHRPQPKIEAGGTTTSPNWSGCVTFVPNPSNSFDDGCLASYSTVVDLGSGTFITMTGSNNAQLSIPTDETSHLMRIDWIAAN